MNGISRLLLGALVLGAACQGKPERSPDTIAKSLAIGDPADGPYALELARTSGGVIESRRTTVPPK